MDTLHLATKVPVREDVEMQLVASRAAAEHAAKRRGSPPLLEFGGMTFTVAPHGSRAGPYLLVNENMAVSVTPSPAKNLPTMFIELRALFLWQLGAHRAADAAVAVAQAIGCELPDVSEEGLLVRRGIEFAVSRVDITFDFQGWAPPESPSAYTTRVNRIDPHYVHRRFTGLSFGRGALVARIYDKTEEIKVSDKGWFRALWALSPRFAGHEAVWRLEFQLRREALRSIRLEGSEQRLRTVLEVLDQMVPLTKYLSTRWLSIRGQRTNRNRQVLSTEWEALREEALSQGPWNGSQANLYRVARELSRARCTPHLSAFARKHLALKILESGRRPELAEFWSGLLDVVVQHGERTGRPFEATAAKLAESLAQIERSALAHAAPKKEEP